jgi:proteic killer suppression protein
VIVSFGDKVTEALYHGIDIKGVRQLPPNILKKARNKMEMLNVAKELIDLQAPPGNRLEALQGNLGGYFSIRVNDQWRKVFRWQDGNIYDLKLTDYH